MKDVRVSTTNDEKLAQIVNNQDYLTFNMSEGNIKDIINKEKANQFNNEVDANAEKLESQRKQIEEYQKSVMSKNDTIEIKPLFNRILVKPFVHNPFQKLTVENGIITDIGGLNPNIEFNQDTGEYQERDQNIIVAVVVEVGPECKYTQVGDTVFYLKQLPTPVPFFKQGLWTIKEDNLIAIVNDNLTERFNGLEK